MKRIMRHQIFLRQMYSHLRDRMKKSAMPKMVTEEEPETEGISQQQLTQAGYLFAMVCAETDGELNLTIKDFKINDEVKGHYQITCKKISDEEIARMENV